MHPEKQLCPNTLWVLLLGLLLNIPATNPAKCPQQCICDQIQLSVACVRKNLTQVPPAVDEVWRSLSDAWHHCPDNGTASLPGSQ